MKRAALFLFTAFWALSALSVAGDAARSKPPVTLIPPHIFDDNVTTGSTTTTTTTTTITTTNTPVITTASINSTTGPANTTKTPSTTTPPSPQPTPSTTLRVGTYTLKKDQQVICLMAQMALQIRLASKEANGTFIVQPNLTSVEGGCLETSANLTLIFKEGYITFMYNKNITDNTVYVDDVSFSFSYPFSAKWEKHTANIQSVHLFAARVGHSYSCRNESYYMGDGLYLEIKQDRMQAFNLTKSNEFGPPDSCDDHHSDSRVAIAVGVILLVLIIIVVVAYMLGRRRKTAGYQSL